MQRYACRFEGRRRSRRRRRRRRGGGGGGGEEEEEETVQTLQYSQVHHSGTARPNGVDGDDGEFGSVEEDGDGDAGRPPTKRRRAPR